MKGCRARSSPNNGANAGAGGPDDQERLSRRLLEIAIAFPDLAKTARLFGAILPMLQEENVPLRTIPLTPEEVKDHLEKRGMPILECLDLEVDGEQVTGLLVRLAAAAEKAGARVSAEQTRRWLDERCCGDISMALHELLAGDDALFGSTADGKGMDCGIFRLLAHMAMQPALRSWSRQLAVLAANAKWDKGICFVCGEVPLFAELQGNDQEKHLRCGLCGADWRITRLSCPHCGNTDHRSLRVFLQEDDPAKPRIEACDRCMTYMKVIPAFSPTPVDLLPVEDLATLFLDSIAAEKGYRRAEAS